MRISDWSSDVCSSDLAGHAAEERRTAADRDRHRPQRAAQPLAGRRRGRGRRGGEERRRPVRRAGEGQALPAAGAADDPRSEEHTSELQSLMRISYAVFCLKKKKNKKR